MRSRRSMRWVVAAAVLGLTAYMGAPMGSQAGDMVEAQIESSTDINSLEYRFDENVYIGEGEEQVIIGQDKMYRPFARE